MYKVCHYAQQPVPRALGSCWARGAGKIALSPVGFSARGLLTTLFFRRSWIQREEIKSIKSSMSRNWRRAFVSLALASRVRWQVGNGSTKRSWN